MYYKNVSLSVKTFHGVTFKPGEIKEVNKYINHALMIRVSDEEGKKATKRKAEDRSAEAVTINSTEEASQQPVKQQKPSSEKPKKNEQPEAPAEDAKEAPDSSK